MNMNKSLCKFVPLLFTICFLSGCIGFVIEKPNPISGKKSIPDMRHLTKAEIAHCKIMSDASADLGWNWYSRGDFVEAMSSFNMAWDFNPNNYEPYWGFGLIQGKRASSSKDPDFAKQYFKQSVKFLIKALALAPKEKRNVISLDLANAYIGSGAIDIHFNKQNKAEDHLKEAVKLVEKVLKTETGNGRAYYLMSISHAFLGKINIKELNLARDYASKAERFGYKLSNSYKKEIALYP